MKRFFLSLLIVLSLAGFSHAFTWNSGYLNIRQDASGNIGINKNPSNFATYNLLDVSGTVKADTFSGAGTGLTGTAASLTAGAVTNLTVSSATTLGQAWTNVVFDASNYTGSASMVWTVEAADVVTHEYIITGKIMTVNFYIGSTTVGGTPDTSLIIPIPASKVSTNTMIIPIYYDDATTKGIGHAIVSASGTTISLYKIDRGAWGLATNTTGVGGSLTFEIN
jgi:hypothetical protein